MSKLLGFGLIVSGLVIGGVAVPLSASSPMARDLQEAALPAASGEVFVARAPTPEKHGFAVPALKPLPVSVVAAPAIPEATPASTSPPAPAAALRPLALPAARKPILPPFETVTVPHDRAAITRALQTELTRVGCYAGPITGFWGPDTRRAMKAFTNRVNASLPIGKPDVILLSLVRAESGSVCGTACPSGQEPSEGRCVPKAVLAQAARKANPAIAKAAAPVPQHAAKPAVEWRAEAVASALTVPPAPLMAPIYSDEQRMALAGPKVEEPGVEPVTPLAVAPEKPAPSKQAKKRERKDPPAGKASYGQTKWAREFFRNNATF